MRTSHRRSAAVIAVAAAIALGVAAPATAAQAARPAVAAAASSTGVTYAGWLSDVTAVTDQAQSYLVQRIASASSTDRLAIVLDIDNTALASYFNPTTYPVPATPTVLTLAKYAAAHGVSVFFVTGRPEAIDPVTLLNLGAVGYPVAGLYSRDLEDLFTSLETFKTGARTAIENRGYTIIANIGNSASDLTGGHAEQTFKLPDYNGLLD
ncbi:putative secreted acid phosphatase [Streptacidiphilus sp. MAP12-16]|uniref:HAD family acid phosphatase n=1 Tax=Streptacidiphilus sp. MAP12-16 TaxID=3156300 RepID=UPI0035170FF4